MKATITLELPEDFRLHCEIYRYDPKDVLQEFVNRVSLPCYSAGHHRDCRWATGFFLDYIDHLAPDDDGSDEVHNYYLNKLSKTIRPIQNDKKREKACRKIMRQWAEAVKIAKK